MKLITIIFLGAIFMASSITLVVKNIADEQGENSPLAFESEELPMNEANELFLPSPRVSRFLAENKNPRAADHCKKDKEVCYKEGGYNPTCCNNKCVDLWDDQQNCGVCKNKCKSTQACCSGECVYLSYDKRNCNKCGNKCADRLECIYGMCDYP